MMLDMSFTRFMDDVEDKSRAQDDGILEELQGKELEDLLSTFLSCVDYHAMGNFFITFRSHLKPASLFQNFRDRFEASFDSPGVAGRYKRVRIFVALRHWILNYYLVDFGVANFLHREMDYFLSTLGGVGADEISTESRIAKELRRTWNREVEICRSQAIVDTTSSFHHRDLLRSRYVSLRSDLLLNEARRSTGLESIAQNIDEKLAGASSTASMHIQVQSIIDEIELDIRSISAEMGAQSDAPLASTEMMHDGTALVRSGPARIDLAQDTVPLDILRTSSTEALQATTSERSNAPRGLKRRPGGILKNARTVADLISSTRYSITSNHGFQTLNRAFSMQIKNSPMQLKDPRMTHKAFVHDLALMFRDDRCDEEQDNKSIVLEDTLAKLEGRTSFTRKRKSTSQESPRTRATLDGNEITETTQTEKRRKHEGCPELADASFETASLPVEFSWLKSGWNENHPSVSTSAMTMPSSHDEADHSKERRGTTATSLSQPLTSDSRSRSSSMVSIIEALAIHPLPCITAQNSMTDKSQDARSPYSSWLLEHNEALISQCLASIEKAICLEFDWLELVSCSWAEDIDEVKQDWRDVIREASSATRMVLARINLVTAWILSEILRTTILEARVRLVTKLVDIAQLCRDHNNFSTLVQIVSALQHPAIRRLSQTWQQCSDETRKTWYRLYSLCDYRGQWRTLKAVQERILKNPEICVIPFLGPYLSDLLANRLASYSITEKMQTSARNVRMLMDMQSRMSMAQDDQVERSLIDRLVWISGVNDEEADRLSLLCERR